MKVHNSYQGLMVAHKELDFCNVRDTDLMLSTMTVDIFGSVSTPFVKALRQRR